MTISQFRSKRKFTGKLYKKIRKKKKRDFGSDFFPLRIGKLKTKSVRALGENLKTRILQTDVANITDPSTGKTHLAKIITVKENPANIHFVRMNVITKGALIETELGLARVTSRPSQDGTVNAVLIKK